MQIRSVAAALPLLYRVDLKGGEWTWIGAGRGNKERRRAEGVRLHLCQEIKGVTGAQGGDLGVKIGWDIIRPPVFFPFLVLSFFFFWRWGVSLSAHPRATNYNSHVTHSTHNKS